mgnify:FL=1
MNDSAKITDLINDCKSRVRKQRKRPTDNVGRLQIRCKIIQLQYLRIYGFSRLSLQILLYRQR